MAPRGSRGGKNCASRQGPQSCSAQSSRKTRWNCATTGPSTAMCVSRQPLFAGLDLARRTVGARAGRIGAADVDAAGEGDAAVDHQDLAMVAVVDLVDALHRVELADGDAGLAQLVEVCLRRLDRADAVVEDVHPHALLHLGGEECGEPLADFACIEDVGADIDVVARARHRVEHRLVGAGTVDQEAAVVAADHRISRVCGRSELPRRLEDRRRQRASLEGRKQRRDYDRTAKAKTGPAHGCRPAHQRFRRMSFLTERTPCTFFAADTARVACSSESTKPVSCTTPR